jgi:hypothetical protein
VSSTHEVKPAGIAVPKDWIMSDAENYSPDHGEEKMSFYAVREYGGLSFEG